MAVAAGVECSKVALISKEPHEAIIEVANRNGFDLIFMASHGRRGLTLYCSVVRRTSYWRTRKFQFSFTGR
ncbi:MAG: universal stress protein [Methylobacter sp.]